MAALCLLADVKVEVNKPNDAVDDGLLIRLSGVATDALQAVTGRQFGQVTKTAEVWRAPRVTCDRDGTLRVLLRTPRLTAVTALAYRCHPLHSWTAVDLGTLDYDPDPLSRSSLLRAYAGLGPLRAPLWAQVSYTAGWAGTAADPYPPDLQEVAIWWTGYLYRTKDAPFEKTANPLLGTVTIPSAMPARLKQAVERWKEHPVV